MLYFHSNSRQNNILLNPNAIHFFSLDIRGNAADGKGTDCCVQYFHRIVEIRGNNQNSLGKKTFQISADFCTGMSLIFEESMVGKFPCNRSSPCSSRFISLLPCPFSFFLLLLTIDNIQCKLP